MTKMLLRGGLLACLGFWLTSCASDPIIEYRTVEKQVPVVKPLAKELTVVEPEPRLKAGTVTNDDLADLIERLRVWGRGMAGKLREIERLQPKGEL